MNVTSRFLLSFLLFALTASHISRAAERSDAFHSMANAARAYYSAGVKDITAEQLWKEMNDADTTQPYVISVRTLEDDTVRGHIPGARHWEPADLVRYRDQLPADKKIVIYCYTGQSSAVCTAYLNLIGFDAYNLRWGLCAWTSDTANIGHGGGWYVPSIGHQKLETKARVLTAEYSFPEPSLPSGEIVDLFSANVEPEIAKPTYQWKMKSSADVYANLQDADSTNDWFVFFCGPESVYDAGHIPGSYHIPPATLSADINLRYLPPDRPIVVYCSNGATSMQVITLLNALGYDAYSLKRGLNTITDDETVLGATKWHPQNPDYPLNRGSIPIR